jgi:dTDP-glucose 4,6-dehydratase
VSDRLLAESWEVVCVDSLLTGDRSNLDHLRAHAGFTFIRGDVSDPVTIDGGLDAILHLASPASPSDYLAHPIETLRVGSVGTEQLLDLAVERRVRRFVLSSTSEVYGDPLVHPQPETYWGNVNPVGPRSVYDEAKRFAEAIAMSFHRVHGLGVGIARIFNTYGPRMRRADGRAVPTFIDQALTGRPLTVHGDGSQTRSLCFVDDLVEGIFRLLMSDHVGPVNLGNPEEVSVLQIAERVRSAARGSSEIVFTERPVDDPEQRCPDITLARRVLGWEPTVGLGDGLDRTIGWAKERWAA